MRYTIDLTGRTYGKLTVMERDEFRNGRLYWFCQCSCGMTPSILGENLRRGLTFSCGCNRRTANKLRALHNDSYSVTHGSWRDARSRCRNPNNKDYPNYGGRGIIFCERWDDYRLFLLDMGKRPQGLTLDRIDVNGHYEPGNCKWSTPLEQANNRRDALGFDSIVEIITRQNDEQHD